MSGLAVLVCGGRDFSDAAMLRAQLDRLHAARPIAVLIEGDARGADKLAGEWAEAHGVTVRRFPADWQRYGRSAGPRRNQQMLDEGRPDLVVAFPGGKGTAGMVKLARAAGCEVIEAGRTGEGLSEEARADKLVRGIVGSG